MPLPYIKLFGDNSATIDLLSDAEAGRLLKALLHYNKGEEVQLVGQEKLVFAMLKLQIDRDAATYQSFIDKQRENGKKGGRPKTQVNPTVTQSNPNNPSLFEKTQKSQEKEKDKEEEKEKDNKRKRAAVLPDGFERFWDEYPKHQSKQDAIKAFTKLKPDAGLLEKMIASLKAWKCSQQWTKDNGQYIPLPATWLNGHRWEDETPNIVPIKSTGWNYTQRSYTEDELENRTDAI